MLTTIEKLVREAAERELMPRFNRTTYAIKRDGSIVTEADTATQQYLQQALARHFERIAFLGEEMSVSEQEALLRRADSGLWILDPLDGTSNFAAGIPYFCISLALIRHGEVALGLIYDPLHDECFAAEKGKGATLNGRPLRTPTGLPPLERGIGLVDFKRLQPALAKRLACNPPYTSQRSFGSGALDWCMIASGRCQVYLHGGQKLWDYAAGQLILSEAGGRASGLDGEGVLAPTLAPRSVVAAPSSELYEPWFRWLNEFEPYQP
ncbi:MAG: inositol monophosphatase family protein [Pseudomonadota bacterium]